MALTFRSSIPEMQTVVMQDSDGRRRVAVATREAGVRQWTLALQHPSGQTWQGSFNGDKNEVPLALNQLLVKHENDFKNDKSRGDRPKAPAPDFNRSIEGAAPIIPSGR